MSKGQLINKGIFFNKKTIPFSQSFSIHSNSAWFGIGLYKKIILLAQKYFF